MLKVKQKLKPTLGYRLIDAGYPVICSASSPTPNTSSLGIDGIRDEFDRHVSKTRRRVRGSASHWMPLHKKDLLILV
jgi:hypothetical protein